MQNKYLIIYENHSCILRKQVVPLDELVKWIQKIEKDYAATVLSVSKILVPEKLMSTCCNQPISQEEFILHLGKCHVCAATEKESMKSIGEVDEL